MSHKLLVLVVMIAILAGLILTDKSGTLAEWRFLLAWKFARRDSALNPREATLTYQRLLSALQKKGFRKKPSQTPREFAFSFLTSPMGPAVMEFTQLYNTLRYGQASVSLARLREILEEIVKGSRIAESCLYGIDLPPSTGITCPVMNSLCVARNRTICAMSSALPALRSGMEPINLRNAGVRSSSGNRMLPGADAKLTRIRSEPALWPACASGGNQRGFRRAIVPPCSWAKPATPTRRARRC